MNVPVFVSSSVIDEMICATGFNQVATKSYGIEYKCRWLLERIGIMQREALHGAIIHDNPEIQQLIALVEFERQGTKAYRHTIESQRLELDQMRDELRKLRSE